MTKPRRRANLVEPIPPASSRAISRAGPWFAYALVLLTLAALVLRWRAATDNFWPDEIFNYSLARNDVHSMFDIFTGIKVEHHFLVTLVMYLMGDRMNWLWYRLPSVIAGTGTLALMALVGYRRMRAATLAVILAVVAVSYPLVVYSSEARGYAPAAFFSLMMFAFLEAYWRGGRRWHLLGFWSSTILAILYQPAAVCVSVGLGLWSLVREWRRGGGRARAMREMALCHAIPLAFFAWLYLAVMSRWGSVGGDVVPLPRVLADTMAVALGLPMRKAFRWWALLAGSGLIASSLLILARRVRSDIWVFYLSALVAAPALMLVIGSRSVVYVRYFVVLFPFLYLMLGEALDAVAKGRKWVQTAAIGLGVLMVSGNIIATSAFLRVGRGGYLNAVNYMAANTPASSMTVGGDQRFRVGLGIDFYRRYLPKERSLTYLLPDSWPPEGPDWFIMHNTCNEEDFVPVGVIMVGNVRFRLVKSYPVLGLSGVGWHLYRNDSRPQSGAERVSSPLDSNVL